MNQKRLIIGGVVVAAAIAIVASIVYYQGQKEVRASLALSNVRVPLSPAAPMPPGTAEAYLKVAKEHGGTRAAARALLMGAATRFTDGNYVEAQKAFEQFLKEYPDSPWVPQAHYGIAASLDAQGKTNEAAAKYEEIRRRFANEPIIDETKLALGRLYEHQNKPAEAHKIYSELVQNNPYTGIGSEAGIRKEDLEAKFPDLAKTNAPIMTPPAVTMLTNPPPTATNRTLTMTNLLSPPATNAGGAATLPPLNVKPPPPTGTQPGTNKP